jgi:hypothetical protein
VSPIIEFFTEITEIHTLYCLYSGIILGLIIKYIWSLNTDCTEYRNFRNDSWEANYHGPTIILKIFHTQSNNVVNWIIKMVRRKQATNLETDKSGLLLQ